MKKLVIITMISVFLIFSSSIIHAQGFPTPWQLPNFYGQYNQPWGFEYFIPNYFRQYNYTPQSCKPGEMFRIVLPMYDNIEGVDFPRVAGWEHEGMWGTDYHWQAVYQYGYEPMETGINKDEEGNLVQENTYRALKESQYSKKLVFHYHGSDNPIDTFTVTIKINGPGNYESTFNS